MCVYVCTFVYLNEGMLSATSQDQEVIFDVCSCLSLCLNLVSLLFYAVYAYVGYPVSLSNLLTEALELKTQAIFRNTDPALWVLDSSSTPDINGNLFTDRTISLDCLVFLLILFLCSPIFFGYSGLCRHYSDGSEQLNTGIFVIFVFL